MSTVIQATVNYELFKHITSNREINRSHLKKLKASIERKNYLYLFPIIINKDMEVVDGQHRLQAAVELKKPIFYMIDDKITKADIAIVNNNRKSWTAMDYINFYAEEGHEAYRKLLGIFKKYQVQKMAAIKLISDNCDTYWGGGGTASVLYKEGNINDNDYDLAMAILEKCKKLFNDGIGYAYKVDFFMPLKLILKGTTETTYNVLRRITSENLPADEDNIKMYFHTLKTSLPAAPVTKVEKTEKKAAAKTETPAAVKPAKKKKGNWDGKEVLTGDDFKGDFV